MSNSNAERQSRYRERALKDPQGLLYSRLQTMIDASTAGQLRRIRKATGLSQRAVVQVAISLLAKELDVTV